MRIYLEELILAIIGGLTYVLCEMLWRGRSHWTMFILGGVCFVAIGLINEVIPWCMPIWQQMIIGAAIITILEFFTGCIVNLGLGWNVWDYSDMPGNILGQVCIRYTVIWLFMALWGILSDDELKYLIWGREKPHYCLWKHKEKGGEQ